MLLFLGGCIVGGLVGAVIMALAVAADERRWTKFDNTRTAPRARDLGSAWVVAGNGALTTGSRLGRFFVAKSRSVLPMG